MASNLNGDGYVDLAIADWDAASISLLINTGSAMFAGPVNYAAETGPTSVCTADLDGSGPPDLAVTNYGTNNVSVILGCAWSATAPPTRAAVMVLRTSSAL